jgi:phosphoribosylamine--glycine ligase/phosphoribosylformylglycinamidine cyclo-ligase
MITKDGPKVLEYNVRFGDPETQTLLPLMSADTDLAEIMVACTDHYLDAISIKTERKFSATVVAAAGGYPGPYARGDIITLKPPPSDIMIFHAGTALASQDLTTSGGRVIAATSTAATLDAAVMLAYTGISTIHFPNMHHRTDIGHRALNSSSTPAPQAHTNSTPLTYASAGVDISSGNTLVKRITSHVSSTARSGAPADLGGFGGLFDLAAAGYNSPPTLIGAIDGVGTKLKIAHAMNKHDTVGIDLVAMNVNDLVVQGAEPLFFLDCYSCGKLDVEVAEAFVSGVATGCREAGCALIGGETAEMPGMFASDGGYDAVGATVGAVKQGRSLLPDKAAMQVGDVLLGLASSGCHSNGFSLVRKIVENAGLTFQDQAPWAEGMSVGESLLTPTRIYVKPILKVVQKNIVKGLSHITGGGLVENVPRMLPDHLAAEIDVSTWKMPPVMKWLKKEGNLEDGEFARVLNTGLGMVLVVAKQKLEETIDELREVGEEVQVIGSIVERRGESCVLRNLQAWR